MITCDRCGVEVSGEGLPVDKLYSQTECFPGMPDRRICVECRDEMYYDGGYVKRPSRWCPMQWERWLDIHASNLALDAEQDRVRLARLLAQLFAEVVK